MVRHPNKHSQMQNHKLHTCTSTNQAKKEQRDEAKQSRLANVRVNSTSLPIISQDGTLLGGYLGTALTASLCPKAHLARNLDTLSNIIKAVFSTPLPLGIKQRLLLYGANYKIMHIHCLMALSPTAIASIDSTIEVTCREIWNLPEGFPMAYMP